MARLYKFQDYKQVTKKARDNFLAHLQDNLKDQLPTLKMVNKKDLQIDHSYQRQEIDLKQVETIKAKFKWPNFGVLQIAQRDDGKMYIIDGQHRWLAASAIEKIKQVPCAIYRTETKLEEASVFTVINKQRRAIGAVDTHRTDVSMGEPLAVEIDRLVRDLGLVVKNGKAANAITCIKVVKSHAASDMQAAAEALRIVVQTKNNAKVHSHYFQGLYYLIKRNGLAKMRHHKVRANLTLKGQDAIMDMINAKRRLTDKPNPYLYASVIAKVANIRVSAGSRLTYDNEPLKNINE